MPGVHVPAGAGGRRLRVPRLLAAIASLVAVLGLGYVFLWETPQPTPPEDTPKDRAARFGSIRGNVKTRGVGALNWKTAEVNVPLRKSDLVRTYPSSSAEIRFFDETLVTVRPDSLITIEETSRGSDSALSRVAWKVTSGEINYETTQKWAGSTEAVTPTLRLALEGNSTGTMRVGAGGFTAVAQLSGTATLQTRTGEKVRLGANEGLRVEASGKAGAKQVLPDTPTIDTSGRPGAVVLAEGAVVAVSWSAVSGAAAYRVQVESKAPAGGEIVFDRSGLDGISTSIPGLGAGDFLLRVAGLTADGIQGRFSSPVSLTVEPSVQPRAAVAPPPLLVIDAFEARSNVLRLAGKTDPGAHLTVNGEPVAVQPDGSFAEFVTLARKTGERRIVIRSTSSAGAVSEETRTLPAGQ